MKIIFPTHFSSFNVEVLVLLVMKIIFPTHFSSFNVEALLPPSRLVLSCRLVSSLVFASLLFSFSFSFSSLPPLRLFQAGHALAHSRACEETRITTLAFPRVLRELAANWVLYRLHCHGVILGNGSYTTSF